MDFYRCACLCVFVCDHSGPNGAVTKLQLGKLVGLRSDQFISTWLMKHDLSEALASGTQIDWIIKNETDSHTDNYVPQRESLFLHECISNSSYNIFL